MTSWAELVDLGIVPSGRAEVRGIGLTGTVRVFPAGNARTHFVFRCLFRPSMRTSTVLTCDLSAISSDRGS